MYLAHTDRGVSALLLSRTTPTPVIRTAYLLVLLATSAVQVRSQTHQPIGQWRDHFPYLRMQDVTVGGDKVFCATTNGAFSYSPETGEIERLNKSNALSDVDIRGIDWNEALGMLLVFYSNGNLDLIQGDRSFNMADIKRSAILGNKSINSVHFEGTTAYLACGFGIVVVDLERREVRETWFIGPNGGQLLVNAVTFSNDSIYAATSTGLYVASRNASNLAAFTNWRKRDDMGMTMANGPFDGAAFIGGKLVVNYHKVVDNKDTLLVLPDTGLWERFTPIFGLRNQNIEVSRDGGFLVVAHDYGVRTFNTNLDEVSLQYGYAGSTCEPASAVRSRSGQLWVADRSAGLAKANGGDQGTTIRPNGPLNASCYRMDASGGVLYVATGSVAGNWGNSFVKDGVHHYVNGEWRTTNFQNNAIMAIDNGFGGPVNDVIAVAVDPRDPDHAFVGSWDDGLIEFRGREAVANYTAGSSSLQIVSNDGSGKVNVGGLDFDQSGNLWMTNGWAAQPVSVRTAAGVWKSFSPGSLLAGNLLISDIFAASNGYKWIVRPRGNALMVFNDAGTIEDTSDDQWKLLNNTPGSGGLPSPDVFAVAEDKEGQIWVGTGKGVAVFYTPSAIFGDGDFDAQQILIEQDGNVQILLETEFVSNITVDGANRKWVGTQTSGVYLLSADGREQLLHFTAENSPLPSNGITSVAIDGVSGEVFFGTERGIIGYRSDATEGGEEATCASVFPNPVRESYTGPIAITGLLRDSEVKITDVSGNLVYRTSSVGGQAIWSGTDMSGNRVATGVYLVLAADRTGTYKCNTKLLVVR